jgi:high affinity sulfate transporter 1
MAENNKMSMKSFQLFRGIFPIHKSQLFPDILAGITLAALGIPEVMGYSKIINLPVVTGLYTMLLPMLAFAIFGSSKHLVVGADSATAAIVAAGLIALSLSPESPGYFNSAKMVALIAGVLLLLARIFRVGFIADFLSRTVLIGFLTGVGIQVAFAELPHMLGIPTTGLHFIGQLSNTVSHLPETSISSLIISSIAIVIIVILEKIVPKFPGALLVVIGMIVASATYEWENHGVAIIGKVPGGMPELGFPKISWADTLKLLPLSFSCFIVVIAQSAATSRAYAVRYHDDFSEDRDLIGLSLANLAAASSNTFIVNGSPTKTAMVDSAGGKSQISQLATVTVVLIVLLFLTKPLGFLPNAVLASIVFLIGVKLIDVRGMKQIRIAKPKEFLLALATSATVILVGVEQGILLAILLSLLEHIRKSYRPFSGVILHDPKEQWRLEKAAPNEFIEPGLVMYWYGAELYYANANHFAEEIRKLLGEEKTKPRWLAVDASALTSIDYSAGCMLRDLLEELNNQHVLMVFTRVDQNLRSDLDQLGLTKQIGEDHLFLSRSSCIEAFRKTSVTFAQ